MGMVAVYGMISIKWILIISESCACFGVMQKFIWQYIPYVKHKHKKCSTKLCCNMDEENICKVIIKIPTYKVV